MSPHAYLGAYPYADMLRKHPEAVFLCNPHSSLVEISLSCYENLLNCIVSVHGDGLYQQLRERRSYEQHRSAKEGTQARSKASDSQCSSCCGGKRVVAPAAVYCSAVLEYLTAEVMELAGSACKEFKMKTITPRHMQLAIRGDDELSSFIKGQIAGGGVVPHHLKESLLLLLRCQIFMSQRARAIDLYRRLIGYSKQLKLTDRDYFCERIRQSYVASINKPESVVEKYIKKGEELLQKRRFI
uniref:Histone H2A n=1 Tax=Ditylenchus dipsaci TaxID=166011 RepID=A0A915CRT5_9BILA